MYRVFIFLLSSILPAMCFGDIVKSFGSQQILSKLWSNDDLRVKDLELKISDYYSAKNTKPDIISNYDNQTKLNDRWLGVTRFVKVKKSKSKNKFIALTFDFCELETKTSGYDGRIIDFLRYNNIPATLFLGGKWMLSHEERAMQLIVDPLFEIGNHAWTHGNFAILPPDKAKEQLLYTQQQYINLYNKIFKLLAGDLKDEFSKIPVIPELFRFPYGRFNDKALKTVHSFGLKAIQWNTLGIETRKPSVQDCEDFAKNLKNGSIILLHANAIPKYTLDFMKIIIKILTDSGYKFVTVSELLAKGEPNIFMEGYFISPGDNLHLDDAYDLYGTAHRIPNKFVN